MFSERLLTTANYKQFQPKALACQQILPSCSSNSDDSSSSSLGAIFSSDGIVLFPTHAPYETVSILPYQSCPQSLSSSGCHLSFSTFKSQHKLASTHTNSVLIWDTTGQSLQPLLNRLDYNKDSIAKCSHSSFIALDWNKHDDSILTTLANTISVWDTRTNTRLRPSSTYVSNSNASILSISSSYIEHEFACIDSCGVVRIYDDRINQFSKSKREINEYTSDQLLQFQAHQAGGLGIESIQVDHDENSANIHNCYISWGIEKAQNPFRKSIKIWEKLSNETTRNSEGFHHDPYWSMGNATGGTNEMKDNLKKEWLSENYPSTYQCSSTLIVDNLSNVRACPKPFHRGILTVSSKNDSSKETSSWQIDLWSLSHGENLVIDNIASYGYNEKVPKNFLGRDLIGSELAFDSPPKHMGKITNLSSPVRDDCEVDLIVCCLDDQGFITTHSIEESRSLQQQKGAFSRDHNNSKEKYITKISKRNLIYQSCSDPDLKSLDVRILRGRGQSDADLHYQIPQVDSIGQVSKVPDYMRGDLESNFKVRREESFLFNDVSNMENSAEMLASVPVGSINVHSKPLSEVGKELDLIEENDEAIHNASKPDIIDPVRARNVPCPRLCGATFGIGGGTIVFNNGDVKKMWQWYNNSRSLSANSDLPHPMKKIFNTDETLDEKSPDFPRSMWGLLKMNEAAKWAQWGDEDESNEEGISGSSPSDEETDTSDEECSDESSSSSDDSVYDIESPNKKPTAGTTDSLVPEIFYTVMFDNIILNGQSPEIADVWKFGPWNQEYDCPISMSLQFSSLMDLETDEDQDIIHKSPIRKNRWNNVKEICHHNAKAALGMEQRRKAAIWNLLAEALNNVSCVGNDDFCGWLGLTGGALGQNLLEEVLKYYEIQRDVQMLATISSVIRGLLWGKQYPDNLSRFIDCRRTNIYIHSYADILYSWGRVEACAELKKHLHLSSTLNVEEPNGLMFASHSQQCLRISMNTSINSFGRKPFHCSICRLPVRGLFTVCSMCGHGGHLQHYQGMLVLLDIGLL